MKFKAVFNRDGGTFRTTDMEAYCQRVHAVFEGAGHRLDCHIVEGKDIISALEQAFADNSIEGVIAGGGDGTISAAAGLAWKSGIPLGVVPAGTMNLFARALALPLDIEAVLETLAGSPVRNVDIATANGRPFVHQFSAGMHARMVQTRDKMEFASRLGKMRASLQAILGVIANPPRLEVRFDAQIAGDLSRDAHKVSAVSISNNPFGENALMFTDDPAGGQLGIYITEPLDTAGALHLAFDLMRGKLKENEAVHHGTASRVELEFPKHRKSVTCVIDGELLDMPPELEILQHPGELKVFSPQVAVGQTDEFPRAAGL
ncbi:diacylglycerol/lipid kinase family protein [Rhizobium halophytocola]|uniref:Diacylglycerol kinase family enzyme n=1 Tax=Rhizobium halophytocola TaxID=735519 RepID=A0ABS4E3D1_9HYPH|nr:diacylglycerol kinase family protein [Rhizobium halophytocola]MBP1852451.1 diacylglycerol kinase family enzyme [Rhizobium halophytocola]